MKRTNWISALALAILAFCALSFRIPNDPSLAAAAASADAQDLQRAGGVETIALEHVDAGGRAWMFDPNESTVEFSGRALVEDRPVDGISVVLVDTYVRGGVSPSLRTTTDREGHFKFAAVPCLKGTYRIAATGGNANAPAWLTFPGCKSKTDIDLRIAGCGNNVYGVVSDASGGPVRGARLTLDEAVDHVALSDAHGAYKLCTQPISATLRATADGYGMSVRKISPRGAVRQDLTLMPDAGVDGVAVFARDQAPVPYAIVTLKMNGSLVVDERQANALGEFRFEHVSPGNYFLEGRTTGAKTAQPRNLPVFASANSKVVLALDDRVRVSGRVLAKDAPAKDAWIGLGFYASSDWSSYARIREDGTFLIDDAPVGSLFVRIDGYEIESPKTLRVPPAGLTNVEIQVTEKGELKVTVLRDGQPVRLATVYAKSTLSSETARTDAAGVATIRGLGDGDYRIVAEHENDFSTKENVHVDHATKTELSLELTSGRQISGKVVDEKGAPVDGARVSFTIVGSTEDTGASAVSGADGSFRGGPLRGPASYKVGITRSGLLMEPRAEFPSLSVPASGPASPADVTLVVKNHNATLSGLVVDASGGPAADVRVIVAKPERHSDTLATTYTANDGTFTFRDLGVGPYAIRATAASASEAEANPVSLPSPPITITLPSVGVIHGTTRGFERTPTIMAWSIAGYDWEDIHFAVVQGSAFTIEGLSKGKFHVAASSAEAAASITVDVDGVTPVDVELVASSKRTIHGRALDLVTSNPLPGLNCQAAPSIDDTRSPVVVPGNVFTGDDGSFAFVDVPASNLYMWCTNNTKYRGGVAKLPSDLGDKVVTVWGLDVQGRPPINVSTLGFGLADDFPFSKRVTSVDAKGSAARAGIQMGDVLEQIAEKSLAEVGNGLARAYLATLLTTQKSVNVVVTRNGVGAMPIVFRAE